MWRARNRSRVVLSFPRTCVYRWAPGNQTRVRTEPAPSDLLKATGMLPYHEKGRTRQGLPNPSVRAPQGGHANCAMSVRFPKGRGLGHARRRLFGDCTGSCGRGSDFFSDFVSFLGGEIHRNFYAVGFDENAHKSLIGRADLQVGFDIAFGVDAQFLYSCFKNSPSAN